MITIAYVMRSVNSGRIILSNQHNQLLARQAAESGIAMAEACLAESGNAVTWSNTKPLRPNTDCYGTESDDPNVDKWVYVDADEVTKTTFRVEPVSSSENNIAIKARGSVEIYGGGGSTLTRSFDHEMSTYVKFQLSFADINFGSTYSLDLNSDIYMSAYLVTKTADGTVEGFGSNQSFQTIPFNSTSDPNYTKSTTTPLPVPLPAGKKVRKIRTNFQGYGWNVVYIMTDNSIYTTGGNHLGQVGNGTTLGGGINNFTPVWPANAQKILPAGAEVVDVIFSGSSFYTLVKDSSGNCCELYANGLHKNNTGETLGLGPALPAPMTNKAYTPLKVNVGGTNKLVSKLTTDDILIGDSTTLALLADGSVWGWGNNEKGQLAVSPTTQKYFMAPTNLVPLAGSSDPSRAIDIMTDGMSSYVLHQNGTVSSFGNNNYGQLGTNNYNPSAYVQQTISFPAGAGKIIKMYTDSYSAFFLSESNDLYGTGYNVSGQLGDASTASRRSPVKFRLPAGVTAESFTTCSPNIEPHGVYKTINGLVQWVTVPTTAERNESHRYRNTFVVGSDGKVYGAGSNYFGQLGIGVTGGNYSTPQVMSPAIIDGTTVRAKYVHCGFGTTAVISTDNAVYTMGNNVHGQLGDGTTVNSPTPVARPYANRMSADFIYF